MTITELAKRCGVAVSTVSRAMNDRSGINPQTRERILQVARETGYIPNAAAKNLKIASTQTVAVIMQGRASELSTQVLGEIRNDLAAEGLDVFPVHVTDEDATAETIIRLSTERRFAGLVFLGRYGGQTENEDQALSQFLAESEIPVVFCTTTYPQSERSRHSSISVDDFTGAVELTEHLIDRGHTRIAFCSVLADTDHLRSDHAWALRYQGYTRALSEAGLPRDPALVIPAAHPNDVYSMENGYDSVKEWLARGGTLPTAIVASCDAAGLGVIRALHELGVRVPQDVSVTGFDGVDFARYSIPTLTTVAQPMAELARETSRVLCAAVRGDRGGQESRQVHGELLVGESTAPPQAGPAVTISRLEGAPEQ